MSDWVSQWVSEWLADWLTDWMSFCAFVCMWVTGWLGEGRSELGRDGMNECLQTERLYPMSIFATAESLLMVDCIGMRSKFLSE